MSDWKLTVDFGPYHSSQTDDGGQPYALQLAAVCTAWEHDCDADLFVTGYPEGAKCSTLRHGVGYDGDDLWLVSEDLSTFVAYSNIIDALTEVVEAAMMRTIPKRLTLEQV